MADARAATVLLFDIDGTLICSGGAGRRALVRTFETLFGVGDPLDFPLDGLTDPSIVRAVLRRCELPDDDGQIHRVFETYLGYLPAEVDVAPTYRVYPGVVELLERATARGGQHAVGLGTGNIEQGARIKLARGDLNRFFSFGGFGSDHEDRVELIRLAHRRGAELLGRPAECRAVVIGDTPHDVAAARAIGARAIGVGTGAFTPRRLLDCGADAAVVDLSTPEAVAAILGAG
jgi:phosphoglycolate phosphatase-like HAD superfamily hydrolase